MNKKTLAALFIATLSTSVSLSAFAERATLADFSRHQDSGILFDKAEYDSYRSGSLHDSKNDITLAIRCYESDSEKTYALKLTDKNATQLTLEIDAAKCRTILNDVVRDGKISAANPLLTLWTSPRNDQTIESLRLVGIQLQDRNLEIRSKAFDSTENKILEQLAETRLNGLRSGQRSIYIPTSSPRVVVPGDLLYVKSSDNQIRIRTTHADVTLCNKKPADTVERFFKNLLGSKCYYF